MNHKGWTASLALVALLGASQGTWAATVGADDIPEGAQLVNLGILERDYSQATIEGPLTYKGAGIASVYGDGLQTSVLVLTYPKFIRAKDLTTDTFQVEGKTVSYVWGMNSQPDARLLANLAQSTDQVAEDPDKTFSAVQAMNALEGDGPYVVLLLEHKDVNSAGDKGASQATEVMNGQGHNLSVTIKQVGNVVGLDGVVYEPNTTEVLVKDVTSPELDAFKQEVFRDSSTAIDLPYNIFSPANVDRSKRYPLVLFLGPMGMSDDVKTPLYSGNGATVWTSQEEQSKHPSFVIAPYYTKELSNRFGALSGDLEKTNPALTSLENFINQISQSLPVDKKRMYVVAQGEGNQILAALVSRNPKLFAAQYRVDGQGHMENLGNASKVWSISSQAQDASQETSDLRFVNQTSKRDKVGLAETLTRTSREWDPSSTSDQFDGLVQADLAQNKPIQSTLLAGGGNFSTPSVAYKIQGIRNWLFDQHK